MPRSPAGSGSSCSGAAAAVSLTTLFGGAVLFSSPPSRRGSPRLIRVTPHPHRKPGGEFRHCRPTVSRGASPSGAVRHPDPERSRRTTILASAARELLLLSALIFAISNGALRDGWASAQGAASIGDRPPAFPRCCSPPPRCSAYRPSSQSPVPGRHLGRDRRRYGSCGYSWRGPSAGGGTPCPRGARARAGCCGSGPLPGRPHGALPSSACGGSSGPGCQQLPGWLDCSQPDTSGWRRPALPQPAAAAMPTTAALGAVACSLLVGGLAAITLSAFRVPAMALVAGSLAALLPLDRLAMILVCLPLAALLTAALVIGLTDEPVERDPGPIRGAAIGASALAGLAAIGVSFSAGPRLGDRHHRPAEPKCCSAGPAATKPRARRSSRRGWTGLRRSAQGPTRSRVRLHRVHWYSAARDRRRRTPAGCRRPHLDSGLSRPARAPVAHRPPARRTDGGRAGTAPCARGRHPRQSHDH